MSSDELADLGGEYLSESVPMNAVTASENFSIDFDMGDIDFDVPRGRHGGSRFRVDRPPPRPPTPTGQRVGQAGRFAIMADGGEMVGERSTMREIARSEASNYAVPGRNFREVRERAAATAYQSPYTTDTPRHTRPEPRPMTAYERLNDSRSSAPSTPAPRPAPKPAQSSRPTAYERLKRGGG